MPAYSGLFLVFAARAVRTSAADGQGAAPAAFAATTAVAMLPDGAVRAPRAVAG